MFVTNPNPPPIIDLFNLQSIQKSIQKSIKPPQTDDILAKILTELLKLADHDKVDFNIGAPESGRTMTRLFSGRDGTPQRVSVFFKAGDLTSLICEMTYAAYFLRSIEQKNWKDVEQKNWYNSNAHQFFTMNLNILKSWVDVTCFDIDFKKRKVRKSLPLCANDLVRNRIKNLMIYTQFGGNDMGFYARYDAFVNRMLLWMFQRDFRPTSPFDLPSTDDLYLQVSAQQVSPLYFYLLLEKMAVEAYNRRQANSQIELGTAPIINPPFRLTNSSPIQASHQKRWFAKFHRHPRKSVKGVEIGEIADEPNDLGELDKSLENVKSPQNIQRRKWSCI